MYKEKILHPNNSCQRPSTESIKLFNNVEPVNDIYDLKLLVAAD